jgi:hypothetical protein
LASGEGGIGRRDLAVLADDPDALKVVGKGEAAAGDAGRNFGAQAAFLCDASACTAIPVEAIMPAKSKAQQKAAGIALSAKRGETKQSDLKGPSKSMCESMSEDQLEEMASGARKGKPEHRSKK